MIIGCTICNVTFSCDRCIKKDDPAACLEFRRLDGVKTHEMDRED